MDNRDLRDEDRFIGVEEDLAVYRYLNELEYDKEPFVNPFPRINLGRGRPKSKPDRKRDSPTKPSKPSQPSTPGSGLQPKNERRITQVLSSNAMDTPTGKLNPEMQESLDVNVAANVYQQDSENRMPEFRDEADRRNMTDSFFNQMRPELTKEARLMLAQNYLDRKHPGKFEVSAEHSTDNVLVAKRFKDPVRNVERRSSIETKESGRTSSFGGENTPEFEYVVGFPGSRTRMAPREVLPETDLTLPTSQTIADWKGNASGLLQFLLKDTTYMPKSLSERIVKALKRNSLNRGNELRINEAVDVLRGLDGVKVRYMGGNSLGGHTGVVAADEILNTNPEILNGTKIYSHNHFPGGGYDEASTNVHANENVELYHLRAAGDVSTGLRLMGQLGFGQTAPDGNTITHEGSIDPRSGMFDITGSGIAHRHLMYGNANPELPLGASHVEHLLHAKLLMGAKTAQMEMHHDMIVAHDDGNADNLNEFLKLKGKKLSDFSEAQQKLLNTLWESTVNPDNVDDRRGRPSFEDTLEIPSEGPVGEPDDVTKLTNLEQILRSDVPPEGPPPSFDRFDLKPRGSFDLPPGEPPSFDPSIIRPPPEENSAGRPPAGLNPNDDFREQARARLQRQALEEEMIPLDLPRRSSRPRAKIRFNPELPGSEKPGTTTRVPFDPTAGRMARYEALVERLMDLPMSEFDSEISTFNVMEDFRATAPDLFRRRGGVSDIDAPMSPLRRGRGGTIDEMNRGTRRDPRAKAYYERQDEVGKQLRQDFYNNEDYLRPPTSEDKTGSSEDSNVPDLPTSPTGKPRSDMETKEDIQRVAEGVPVSAEEPASQREGLLEILTSKTPAEARARLAAQDSSALQYNVRSQAAIDSFSSKPQNSREVDLMRTMRSLADTRETHTSAQDAMMESSARQSSGRGGRYARAGATEVANLAAGMVLSKGVNFAEDHIAEQFGLVKKKKDKDGKDYYEKTNKYAVGQNLLTGGIVNVMMQKSMDALRGGTNFVEGASYGGALAEGAFGALGGMVGSYAFDKLGEAFDEKEGEGLRSDFAKSEGSGIGSVGFMKAASLVKNRFAGDAAADVAADAAADAAVTDAAATGLEAAATATEVAAGDVAATATTGAAVTEAGLLEGATALAEGAGLGTEIAAGALSLATGVGEVVLVGSVLGAAAYGLSKLFD